MNEDHAHDDMNHHLLFEMIRIRRFEERCVELYPATKSAGSSICTSARRRSPLERCPCSIPAMQSWRPIGSTAMRSPAGSLPGP